MRQLRATGPRWQILAVVLAVIVILAIAAVFALRIVDAMEATRAVGARADAQAHAASDALDLLQDAESAQRGFLLTARPDYLDSFRAAQARREAVLGRLEEATRGTSAARLEAALLRNVAERKLAELARLIEVARESGRDTAVAAIRAGEGQYEMRSARAHVAGITAMATHDRDDSVLAIRAREQAATLVVLTVMGLGVLLLAGAVSALLLGRNRILRIGAALELERGRLSGAVANLPDGMLVFDAADNLLLWNRRFFDITGLPLSLARAGVPWSRFAAAAADWPDTPLAAPRPDGTGSGAEVHLRERVLELWRCEMPDGGQMLAAGDITRRTRAEAIARQASKMEALGQLTGGVAHDFNNLLQVVSANLELIGLRITADAALKGRFAAAMEAVERASKLTRHLLAFARKQPLAPEVLDPAQLLRGMEDMLRQTLEHGIELVFVMKSGLWPVRADPAQLENAVLNLAINARDAMPGGGRLTIEAGNFVLDAQYANAHGEVEPGEYVGIAITDTGTGMTREQMSRAMEPFYTTKPLGRGTGLGLPMVFGFTKQSGGHLKLYSEPGHGTTARLYLPRSNAPARAPRKPVDAGPEARSAGELVLLVEDDANVRAAAQLAVQGLGYRVVACGNTAAALAELRDGLRPDLLFSDVVMPGRPTVGELAAEARRMVPGLAVVFTSGYTEDAIVHQGQLERGVILVSKPWRTVDLARQFRVALERAARGMAKGAAMRILLVEDDVLVRLTTAQLLGELGHDVIEAGSGIEARQLFMTRPDLVITDLGLPDMDGLALAAEFRATAAVIVASGKSAEAGADYVWLQKPYDGAALRKAVARAVERV